MRIASLKQLLAARDRLAQGYNNTDCNFLASQAEMIEQQMESLPEPRLTGCQMEFRPGSWDKYDDKIRVLKTKLVVATQTIKTK